MPGVLQVEAMAQVASIVMMRRPENIGKIGYFMSADSVEVPQARLPGRHALHSLRHDQRQEAPRQGRLQMSASMVKWSPRRSCFSVWSTSKLG